MNDLTKNILVFIVIIVVLLSVVQGLAAGQVSLLLVDATGGIAGLLGRASLGEPCLDSLLGGMAAESRGGMDEARRLYAQAELSAPLWNLPLAERLASEALARLR